MKGTFVAEFAKIAAFVSLSLSLLYLSRRYSSTINHQLLSFSLPSLGTAGDSGNFSDLGLAAAAAAVISSTISAPPPPPPPPPPRDKTGIVDENGAMTADFEVGAFDPDSGEVWEDASGSGGGGSGERRPWVNRIHRKYEACGERMREYVPCLDNAEAIKRLNSTERGEQYERHCPNEAEKRLDCLVPRPAGYRTPVPWPQSRDAVWVRNVLPPRRIEEKGDQNQVSINKDKIAFSRGGAEPVHREDHYLDHISRMVPDIAFGHRTCVALDIDCGVANFGAFLLQRNVTTLSIAPKDVRKNQIQLALERGVPAMLAVFATQRLLFPSQAFDLIHCSRCRINWIRDDGILLLEVNRILRAGGYFVWAAQTLHKRDENLQEQWKEMENLTGRICWDLVKKDGDIAIWQKPLNNSCYLNRDTGVLSPLCDPNDDLDHVWYAGLKACIARLPENGYGGNLSTWPARLHYPPDRLQSIAMDAYMSRKDIFKAESKYWEEVIKGYIRAYHWKESQLRNVMDMRAGYGGFAAALHDLELNSWVMNVVPVSGFNTLPVIYDRGLIGVMHDWCEPFDTYPRTYDLLHAMGLFSVERKRCNMSTIVLEMDRMLRPGGHIYIRDTVAVMGELQELATSVGWVPALHDTSEGPHASWKVLRCEKRL